MANFISFRLHGGEYAVPIVRVREIINQQQITGLPNMPEYMEGIADIRGNVIPIINLKKLMHLQHSSEQESKIIVITRGKITYGVLVDSITGVTTINEKDIQPSEGIAGNASTAFVDGIAKLDGRLIIILNTINLIPIYDRNLFEDITNESHSSKTDMLEPFDTIVS
jgi:chemotaxis signal transduction protein